MLGIGLNIQIDVIDELSKCVRASLLAYPSLIELRAILSLEIRNTRGLIYKCQTRQIFYPIKFTSLNVINTFRDLVKKVRNVKNEGLNTFRRLLANIYVLSRYTKRTTKNTINSNVR